MEDDKGVDGTVGEAMSGCAGVVTDEDAGGGAGANEREIALFVCVDD